MLKNKYSSIESIIKTAKNGGMYILVDDENRENEGDLVFCSSDVSSKKINFMAKYGRGLICLSLNSIQAKKLGLTYKTPVNQSRNQTAFTILLKQKKVFPQAYLQKIELVQLKLPQKKCKKEIVSPVMFFQLYQKMVEF